MNSDVTDAENSVWEGDKLGRAKVAAFFYRFLIGRLSERKQAGISGAYVVNIDADWGFGKTFFMERFFRQVSAQHPAVFINAWQTDFTEDPYTAVISEIDAFFRVEFSGKEAVFQKLQTARRAMVNAGGTIVVSAFAGALKHMGRKAIGETFEAVGEIIEDAHLKESELESSETSETVNEGLSEHEKYSDVLEASEKALAKSFNAAIDQYAHLKIKEFTRAKKSFARFRTSLSALLGTYDELDEKDLPLFVFIDELDRCMPTYAITMLERIKHLFDVDNVVFLISTDTKQLSHSINGVYGASFDSTRYLQRFFSRTFKLPEVSPHQIIDLILDKSSVEEVKWQELPESYSNRLFLSEASQFLDMSIREVEQSLDILLSVTTLWEKDFKIQVPLMYVLALGFVRRKNLQSFWRIYDSSESAEGNWFYESMHSLEGISVSRRFSRRDQSQKTITGYDLIYSLVDSMKIPVAEVVDNIDLDKSRAHSAYLKSWLRGVFSSEMNLSDRNKLSYLREYWNLVQFAGYLDVNAD